jgi:hypothetical protein
MTRPTTGEENENIVGMSYVSENPPNDLTQLARLESIRIAGDRYYGFKKFAPMGLCCTRQRQIGDDYYQHRTDSDSLLGRSLRGDSGAALQLATVPVPLLKGINFAVAPEDNESESSIDNDEIEDMLARDDDD